MFYVDAAFNYKTGVAYLGYSDSFFINTDVKKLYRIKDNNEAELLALNWASEKLGSEVELYTDSVYAFENFKGANPIFKCSRNNPANIVLRTYKEKDHVQSRKKGSAS